jgi:hypothetical protein
MHIIVHLDKEEPLDPSEALANVELLGDYGDAILDLDVWVDDWLLALMEGAQALDQGKANYTAQIITETHPLVFGSIGQEFTITYDQSRIKVDSLSQFHQELKLAINSAIEEFGSNQMFSPESLWRELKRYADS